MVISANWRPSLYRETTSSGLLAVPPKWILRLKSESKTVIIRVTRFPVIPIESCQVFVVGGRRFIRLGRFRHNKVKCGLVSKPYDLKAMSPQQPSRALFIRQHIQVKRRVFL